MKISCFKIQNKTDKIIPQETAVAQSASLIIIFNLNIYLNLHFHHHSPPDTLLLCSFPFFIWSLPVQSIFCPSLWCSEEWENSPIRCLSKPVLTKFQRGIHSLPSQFVQIMLRIKHRNGMVSLIPKLSFFYCNHTFGKITEIHIGEGFWDFWNLFSCSISFQRRVVIFLNIISDHIR